MKDFCKGNLETGLSIMKWLGCWVIWASNCLFLFLILLTCIWIWLLWCQIHGILNVVSWGIMFPVGAIIARYLRTFQSADPAWFYLHAFCQTSAYAIGVAGWGTGLKLGSESKGVQYTNHRNIGIALFCLATVQVFFSCSPFQYCDLEAWAKFLVEFAKLCGTIVLMGFRYA